MPRLAFASSTGLMVDEHFGRCGRYVIVDLDGNEWRTVETRLLPPPNAEGHAKSAFERAADLLSDCDAVFAAKIGPYAAEILINRCMRVFEAPYTLEAVIESAAKTIEW
ncbi:MAG TPA: NifB/NifX family molybdenum-iron cluster-binding protein [Feifaniaceae bacterium]|nr:NifB/NifX family molybdenum-iron cluster-binding protein [Feifaniaceae bacterium]